MQHGDQRTSLEDDSVSKKKTTSRHRFLDVFAVNLHLAVTRPELRHMLEVIPSMEDPRPAGPAGATSGHDGYNADGAITSYHVAFWVDRRAWRRRGSDPARLAEICAHEAAHAAGMIWRHIGATINHDTLRDDEPMAYLLGDLAGWLYAETVADPVE